MAALDLDAGRSTDDLALAPPLGPASILGGPGGATSDEEVDAYLKQIAMLKLQLENAGLKPIEEFVPLPQVSAWGGS